MGRINQEQKPECKGIVMLQETVEQLRNNTIIHQYYDVLQEIIKEGYSLSFISYDGESTPIEDIKHLRNYINNIVGIKYFS